MFLNISGLNEMSIVDVLQNPVLQTVMQCWTKLYLMVRFQTRYISTVYIYISCVVEVQ